MHSRFPKRAEAGGQGTRMWVNRRNSLTATRSARVLNDCDEKAGAGTQSGTGHFETTGTQILAASSCGNQHDILVRRRSSGCVRTPNRGRSSRAWAGSQLRTRRGSPAAARQPGEWRRTDPAVDQARVDADESPSFTAEPSSPATVETYTVVFGREGEPEQGIVIGRLGDGTRFIANTPADAGLFSSMTSEEFIGRKGRVSHDAATQKNLFEV